jgi:hypothetical protein
MTLAEGIPESASGEGGSAFKVAKVGVGEGVGLGSATAAPPMSSAIVVLTARTTAAHRSRHTVLVHSDFTAWTLRAGGEHEESSSRSGDCDGTH